MRRTQPNQTTYKIIVLGDSYVGKTSFINQFVNNTFSLKYKATIGVDFSTKMLSIGEALVNLQLWDPSGTERFRSISDAFFRGTDGCILVCSVASLESFTNLEDWRDEMNKHLTYDIPYIAIANKCDVDEMEWQVTRTRFEQWCKKNDYNGYFVSAKDNVDVEKAIQCICEKIIENQMRNNMREMKNNPQPIIINEKTTNNSGCC